MWAKICHFFDLPDFLTWRATGSLSRSLCSLVCKYTYQAAEATCKGWSGSFFRKIGLGDLVENNSRSIGSDVKAPGTLCGNGLTIEAAQELGLNIGTSVGTSIIDAYSGVLGCLGCHAKVEYGLKMPPIKDRLTLICGTSTCHMALSEQPCFVPGVWGPYYSTVMPYIWNNEGGQSASGKLIDFIVESHPAYAEALQISNDRSMHIHSYLNELLQHRAAECKLKSVAWLTRNLHIWPDFHGNRSPLADPSLKGMMSGLSLSVAVDDLAVLYLATIQALTYGTRHILSEMKKHGCGMEVVYMCGGLRKNRLFVQCHADILGLPIILPCEEESVLLGSAILGASASGNFSSIKEALDAMGGEGDVIVPDLVDKRYHDVKYEVFLKMLADQREYANNMKEFNDHS